MVKAIGVYRLWRLGVPLRAASAVYERMKRKLPRLPAGGTGELLPPRACARISRALRDLEGMSVCDMGKEFREKCSKNYVGLQRLLHQGCRHKWRERLSFDFGVELFNRENKPELLLQVDRVAVCRRCGLRFANCGAVPWRQVVGAIREEEGGGDD